MLTPERLGPVERPPREEILRSAILNEIWVNPADPKVYLLLVHKISQQWWEVPGGKIEGIPMHDLHFVDEAVREFKEEVTTSGEDPRVEYLPISFVGDDLLGSDSDIVLDDGKRKITSHPFIIRQEFDRLPQFKRGIGDPPEHDDFLLLDVTSLYFGENILQAREELRILFGNLEPVGVKGHLKPVTTIVDAANPGVVRLNQPALGRGRTRELIPSTVTARVFDHYFNPINAKPPPRGFPNPNRIKL